ncbi:MAG: patatin-like phospholipase family protein [Armatimonadetes bacterium]|nr:patatin-like phospholipase family protein [Armatimonadota bacterium]
MKPVNSIPIHAPLPPAMPAQRPEPAVSAPTDSVALGTEKPIRDGLPLPEGDGRGWYDGLPLPEGDGRGWYDGLRRLGKKIAGVAHIASIAVPVLGSLIGANAVALMESVISGEKRLSAVDWLRKRTPGLYAGNVHRLLELAGGRTERSIGLSVDDLLSIDKHFYRMLAPSRDARGVKQPPEFLLKLARAGPPGTAYVYLGEGRDKDAALLMERWKPGEKNPFPEGDDRAWVWKCLEEKAGKGELPIFMDLDGDPLTFTPTEHLARETLASLVERSNTLGNGFADPTLYYGWLNQRMESYYQKLDPWLKLRRPEIHQRVEDAKTGLRPPWLGAKEGLGPWPSPQEVERAAHGIRELGRPIESSRSPGARLADFADAAIALDRDMLTGVQSHWIKLLRELGSDGRKELLRPLARAWVGLNLVPPADPDFEKVAPPDGPLLTAVEKSGKRSHREYDRAMALGEVVDHTLNGLGIQERRDFVAVLREEVAARSTELEMREGRMRAALGSEYSGLPVAQAVRGELTPDAAEPGMGELRRIVAELETRKLATAQHSEVQRHRDLVDWLVQVNTRYGDVDLGLVPNAGIFERQPLAVSEYFDPSGSSSVTLLGRGPTASEPVGDARAAAEIPVSMVLEGGGGKGFAYLEPLNQLRSALETAGVRVRVDEFVGTSAGAITALLLAAGFTTAELAGVMDQLDFKKFNSDAMWLMGGVDPKVRGINRTGLFSMQKMYRTLHELLSKKLGIEGRPILFRDLPFQLKVTGTVLNTDLPADDPLRQQIDADGRLVMGSGSTPNFDAVGAVLASAAVPGFFNAPQMLIGRGDRQHRIQFCDGGVVDNLPVTAATRDGKTGLMMLPVHYEATDPATGKPVALTTLNFDQSALPVIDAFNRQRYAGFAPRIGAFVEEAQQAGVGRLVLALNLASPADQALPLLQGAGPESTEKLHRLAEEAALPRMTSGQGRKLMAGMVERESLGQKIGRKVFDAFLDHHEQRQERLEDGQYRVVHQEEEDVLDILRGAGAAALAARTRRFEEPDASFDWVRTLA